MEIKTNKNGVNVNIKAHILSDEDMRRIGFTDYNKDVWYFCRIFDEFKPNKKFTYEISFNVSINKNNPDDLRIDVLDEDFLQPYDYQYILTQNPSLEYALQVKEFVEKWMKYLQDNGVLSGHEYGEYI